MTCNNAQDAVMLYQEKRLARPFKSLSLHRHISKCENCRQFFVAMDKASEADWTGAIPDNFTDAVMAKVYGLPNHPVAPDHPAASDHPAAGWLRLAGHLYTLTAAIILIVLYNVEALNLNPPTLFSVDNSLNAFLSELAQVGFTAAHYTANMVNGTHLLIFAVALILTAIGIDAGKRPVYE